MMSRVVDVTKDTPVPLTFCAFVSFVEVVSDEKETRSNPNG